MGADPAAGDVGGGHEQRRAPGDRAEERHERRRDERDDEAEHALQRARLRPYGVEGTWDGDDPISRATSAAPSRTSGRPPPG